MKVGWERTVIAGLTAPEDFLARDETRRDIGRIYRQIGGHSAGGWSAPTLIGRVTLLAATSRQSKARPVWPWFP